MAKISKKVQKLSEIPFYEWEDFLLENNFTADEFETSFFVKIFKKQDITIHFSEIYGCLSIAGRDDCRIFNDYIDLDNENDFLTLKTIAKYI